MAGQILFILLISVWLVDAKAKDNDVIGSITKRLDSLESSNRALTHANMQLKDASTQLKAANTQLMDDSTHLKAANTQLVAEIHDLKEEFGLLKSQIDTLQKRNDNLMMMLKNLTPAMNYRGVMGAAAYTCPQVGATCLDGLYANVYDCQTYWSCTNCVETLMNCDPELEFSDADKMCVAPAESGCAEIPSTTTTGTTTTTSDGVNTTVAPTTTIPPTTTTVPLTTTTVPLTTTTTTGLSCMPSPPVLCDSSGIVAFFVRDADHTADAAPVIFEDVQLNLGGAYDVVTGEFTAPVTGLYLLSYNGMADNSCGTVHSCLLMYKNDVELSSSCSEWVASGGTSITVLLTAGDVIWIESNGVCGDLYNIPQYNTFAGHLLFQIQ